MEQSKGFKVINIKIMKKRIYNIKYNCFASPAPRKTKQLSLSFMDKKKEKENLKKEHPSRKKEKIRYAVPRGFVQTENISRIWESLRSQRRVCICAREESEMLKGKTLKSNLSYTSAQETIHNTKP